MLEHNFTAPLTHPVGISNDVMAAVPGDAYLAHILRRLASWNHWLFIKYIQASGRRQQWCRCCVGAGWLMAEGMGACPAAVCMGPLPAPS